MGPKGWQTAVHGWENGEFNQAMVDHVGCDHSLSRFRPDEPAELIQDHLRKVSDTDS